MSKTYVPEQACSPTILLETLNYDFHEFLRKNCMLGKFKPMKGQEITILVPDAKRTDAIKKISDDSELIKAIDSLIIPIRIKTLSEFGSTFTTKAGFAVPVDKITDKEVVLANGCKITPLKKMRISRNYFSAFDLSGVAPLLGEAVEEKPAKAAKKGGFMLLTGSQSYLRRIQYKVEDLYRNPNHEAASRNAYFKKVFLQLRILRKHLPDKFTSGEVFNHLGNDEITTSYLLDLITDEYCAERLYKCLGGSGPCPERTDSITFADFVQEYNSAIEATPPALRRQRDMSAAHQAALVAKISLPIDARVKCKELYRGNLTALGRDLFIVFSNVTRETWLIERKQSLSMYNSYDQLNNDTFDSYVDVIRWSWLPDLERRVHKPPSTQEDVPDFFTLVTSDALLFTPRPLSTSPPYYTADEGYKVVDRIPEFTDKTLFSINALMVKLSSTGGIYMGGKKEADILDEYLN